MRFTAKVLGPDSADLSFSEPSPGKPGVFDVVEERTVRPGLSRVRTRRGGVWGSWRTDADAPSLGSLIGLGAGGIEQLASRLRSAPGNFRRAGTTPAGVRWIGGPEIGTSITLVLDGRDRPSFYEERKGTVATIAGFTLRLSGYR